jgi:hypothetical protein
MVKVANQKVQRTINSGASQSEGFLLNSNISNFLSYFVISLVLLLSKNKKGLSNLNLA